MTTLIWIIVAIIVIGVVIYLFKDKIFKKKEGEGPSMPPTEGPTM